MATTLDFEFVAGTYVYNGTSYASLAATGATLVTPATFAVKSDNTLVAASANTGRISNAGLLVEETRTNYQQFSDGAYTNAYYGGAGQSEANGQTDPAGGTKAGLMTRTTNAGLLSTTIVNNIGAGVACSFSVYLKAGTLATTINISNGNSAGTVDCHTIVNTTTGVLTSSGVTGAASEISANSTTVGGGFYRVDVNGSFTASMAAEPALVPQGTGTGTLVHFGWQQELGGFATSYIRTTSSASVTRNADSIKAALVPSPTNAFHIDCGFTTTRAVNQARTLFDWNDGTDNNKILLQMDSTSHLVLKVINGGTTTTIATEGGTPAVARSATATVVWDGSANWTLKVGGTAVASAAAAIPAVTSIQLGNTRALSAAMNDFITNVAVTYDSFSGTLASTEATDTAAVAAQLIDPGALASTEATDTAAFTAALPDAGALAATEAADTAAFAGQIYDAAALATTEAADTAAITGQIYDAATLASTEAADTASFAGKVPLPILAVVAASEAADVASFAARSWGFRVKLDYQQVSWHGAPSPDILVRGRAPELAAKISAGALTIRITD